mgnify:CR=1 FL=1
MKNIHSKWILLLTLALVWGSSFILMQKGLESLSAVQMGSLRIIFAGVFLLLLGFKQLHKIPKHKWKYLVLTACFGTFFPVYLFAFALTQIDGSVSAILNSLTPLNTLIIGTVFFGVHFQKRQLYGVLIGFVGSFLIIYSGAENSPNQEYLYTVLVIIAAICYAVNVNLLKKHLSDVSPLAISAGNFAIMLVPAIIILSCTNFYTLYKEPQVVNSMGYILILAVIGTGLAKILFFKLIQMASPIFASSVTYLIPVVATVLGVYFYEETLENLQLIGAVIVLFGVYLSSKK